MKKPTHVLKGVAACLLSLSILGCASTLSVFQDRKRALFYSAPESDHPYSRSVLKELGYSPRWSVPLPDLVNVDVSDMRIQRITDQSVVVSIKEMPLAGSQTTHFLVSGASGSEPRVVRKTFPGNILPVDGKIYCVEENKTGFILTSCDDALNQQNKKNIVFYKLRHSEKNQLDSSNTGNFHLEDNVSDYFVAYPYVVFTSVNFITDKYYESTRYQSQKVASNTVAFVCVNLLTGETFKTVEANFGGYYKNKFQKLPGDLFTPAASRFYVVQDGNAFVFSLRNDRNEYINGYFYKDAQKDADLYADTAENVTKRFPSLSIDAQADDVSTKEQRILDQALSAGTTLALEGQEKTVIGYQRFSDDGYMIYTRDESSSGSPCALYYTDLSLETVRWKHAFRSGVVVAKGSVNLTDKNVLLPDCDESGGGYLFIKKLLTGEEVKLLPVNLYQTKFNAGSQGFIFFDEGIVLYDDEKSTVSYFTQTR